MKNWGSLLATVVCSGLILSCTNRSGTITDSEPALCETDIQENTVTDIDGNVYDAIRIGSQTWMGQNLKTTRYNDGGPISLVSGATEWAALTAPGYCWYNNDSSTYHPTYGALYNGYVVMTGKLCPDGWHVPGNEEWASLINYLGGEVFAGYRLKDTGTNYWVGPNLGASNESGLTVRPSGLRYIDGLFHDFGFGGYWWTSTEFSSSRLYFRHLNYEDFEVFSFNNLKKNGFSVRCIKDT